MLTPTVEQDTIRFGERFAVSFQRTLRIPDDGRDYPLPPGLGCFPVRRVEDFADRVPAAWRARGGVFIPMYQCEALWLSFDAAHWKPNAVKVGVGAVNAVSGSPWNEALCADPQDYAVCPNQPWLDGINAGEGFIRQFVAMPLGSVYTVEAQVTGEETFGGIQIMVVEPKPGIFPDEPPVPVINPRDMMFCSAPAASLDMGLSAGGRMRQQIYPDPFGIETWDLGNRGSLHVHIVNSEEYAAITGEMPPPTPASADIYTRYGLPWFDLYDQESGDIAPSPTLAKVKSIHQINLEKDIHDPAEPTSIAVPDAQVVKLPH